MSFNNADAVACVDVKLFHSYFGAVFMRSQDSEYCHNSLLPRCDF